MKIMKEMFRGECAAANRWKDYTYYWTWSSEQLHAQGDAITSHHHHCLKSLLAVNNKWMQIYHFISHFISSS